MCCSLSFAEPARIDDRIIKFRPSKSKFFESTGYRKINNEFSKFTEAANVEHIPTGAKARINAKITASVSRAAVLSGVGKLVRQGAKFSTRAVPYVGTALLAHDVYETFKEDIQARGYQYDTETDKFVKGYEYSNCIWDYTENGIKTYGCYGVDSSIMRLMYDESRFPEVKELMESQMERLARPYWEKLRNRPDMYYFKNYNFKRCYFGLNGGDCLVAKGDDGRTFISFSLQGNSKYKEEMDAKKLEEILSLKVDANPDKYIKATGYPGYSEKVEVAPGTKVNMGPVTDRNGNPVQVVATFGRDSQGNTTVDVQVIPRPDLTPGSAEAPNAQPLPEVSPAENPANNPAPNENPGTRPNPEPDPDLNPDANPDTDGQPGTSPDSPAVPDRPNGRDGKDGGLLCKFFPDILACDRLPEPNPAEDLNLPSETVNVEFKKSGIFQDSAQCPAPVTFTITVLDSSKQFAFSFENACTIAERLRYMLLALAWAVAAFFCIRTVSREV
ncbi:T cell/B cell stimulating protein TspB [Neisseria meningitidis]|uniref:IgG-binding virulence factor TspB family protein n=1 Tax=Neisseria meningitidis TaxID=487 RepID=UPI000E595271|nr:IgG-binding virulence factor TspB family protein [Neisseria meningitidis]MBH2225344.1 T cell/B cell stimulating protein TspB [Neisseria meningitidis]MBH2236957.1 T cell/B cell stimulating protein TspB [Neisseria meningitidis]MBH2445010.1 T cell/B cell stimulating protein TspB [Neisseria meningitidis]MBH2476510.1 T cell/B cell stimulating protein TspB [Neisseria meningitidis]MBH5346882.1 T cell/B cell stimulating protein TspB [Neisseria meningitidis]